MASKRKYQPSATAIDKDLVFTKNDVTLYVKLPPLPYEFIEYSAREALAESLNIGLESILVSQEKEIECHLIMTYVPFDVEDWKNKLEFVSSRFKPLEQWKYSLDSLARHVKRQKFRSREVYLGIKIGMRHEFKGATVTGSLGLLSNLLTFTATGQEDSWIADKELEFWHDRAQTFKNRVCLGALRAEEITSEDIVRLIKETLWPAMPIDEIPYSEKQQWGTGEIASIGIGTIQNSAKGLKITQFHNGEFIEGYKATLCFSRFPDEIVFPRDEPWMHYTGLFHHPTTIYSRFTIEPARKVEKVVANKEKDALDQFNNSNGNAPLAIVEQLENAQLLKHSLSRDRKPWMFGRHRIVVTARSQKELESNVQNVINQYKELNIEVVWPSGDQVNLLLESQPGDHVRSKAYYQRQELGIISVGMPNGSGKVGDSVEYKHGQQQGWLGPYIGRTNSRVEEPVFVSIHSAIAKNNPPGCVITGAPGGGKTFAGLSMTYMMALQNIWTILIDPKGDALPMQHLPGIRDRVQVLDLKSGFDGILDPFTMSPDPASQKLLAVEVVSLFLGGNLQPGEKNALMETIHTVSSHSIPSLNKVVDMLLEHPEKDGRALGNTLRLIRDLPFARLCFAPNRNPDAKPLNPEDGLTIISLKSLDLPSSSKSSGYTTSNWLAIGIMYLLASYTESLMNGADQKHPKAVVIDEAWSITSTAQGQNMIQRLARMGRSLNTAIICISQNAADFQSLTNSMPYRLAFGTKDTDEIEAVAKFLGLEAGENGKTLEGNFKTIHGLSQGNCLMRDPEGRIQSVQIDNWNQELFDRINTNPDTKKA